MDDVLLTGIERTFDFPGYLPKVDKFAEIYPILLNARAVLLRGKTDIASLRLTEALGILVVDGGWKW